MGNNILSLVQKGKAVLLADGGSTKMEWIMLNKGKVCMRHTLAGVNPLVNGMTALGDAFEAVQKRLPVRPDIVGYFGAGCVDSLCDAVAKMAELTFHCQAECGSDIALAARLLCSDEDGLVCILGTGSNSAYYKNGELQKRVPSLGFILGDEGSACAMGRRIVADSLRDNTDKITAKAWKELDLSLDDVLSSCYGRDIRPSAFLGSVVNGMAKYFPESDYLKKVAADALSEFFKSIIDNYKLPQGSKLYFVGGIAKAFAEQIKKLASKRGLIVETIQQRPFDVFTDKE